MGDVISVRSYVGDSACYPYLSVQNVMTRFLYMHKTLSHKVCSTLQTVHFCKGCTNFLMVEQTASLKKLDVKLVHELHIHCICLATKFAFRQG